MTFLLLINTVTALTFMLLYVMNTERINTLEKEIKILKQLEKMKNDK